MGRISRVFLVAGITCAGLAGTRLAAAAPAALKCGDRVTASITLTADVGPCPKEGLVVKADGITVNLGGH